MEHNGSYTSDPSHNSDREGRGGNVFAGIIIAIVLVLLALMIVGLFLPGLLGETPQEIAILDMTPTPQTDDGGLARYAVLSPKCDVAAIQEMFIITDFDVIQ